ELFFPQGSRQPSQQRSAEVLSDLEAVTFHTVYPILQLCLALHRDQRYKSHSADLKVPVHLSNAAFYPATLPINRASFPLLPYRMRTSAAPVPLHHLSV